jgi:hypothetical protein
MFPMKVTDIAVILYVVQSINVKFTGTRFYLVLMFTLNIHNFAQNLKLILNQDMDYQITT